MKKTQEIFKNKKIIIGIVTCLIFISAIVLTILLTKKDEEKELKEQTYTMYVSINPLVKLVFTERYYECTNKDGKKEICSEATNEVIDYELLNNDAKDVYNDIDFKKMNIIETLIKLCDVARDNGIGFESLKITTDYNFNQEEISEGIKNGSKYNSNYDITINFQEHLNEQEILNQEILENPDIVSFKVTFDSNGGSKVTEQLVIEKELAKEPTPPTKNGYEFVEWLLNDKKYDFSTSVTKDITLKAKWKKITTTTPTTDDETKPSENKPITKPEEPDDGITSTLNKINLNENILVSKNNSSYSDANTYIFSDNISTILAKFQSNYGNNSYLPPSFTDEYRDGDDQKRKELDKEFNEKLSQLTYNSAKAETASKQIKSYLQTRIGIKNIKINNDPKDFHYSYDYLYIHNEESLGNFGESFNKYFIETRSHSENIKKNNGVACIEGGGLGGGEEPVLLTETLCQEYNLNCARW